MVTDNSFNDDEKFLKIGPDILDRLRMGGLDKVNESLESWLFDTSCQGSGDDITLGIMCRMDALEEKENPSDDKESDLKEDGLPHEQGEFGPCTNLADQLIE